MWYTNRSVRDYRFSGVAFLLESSFINLDLTRDNRCHFWQHSNNWVRKIKLINNLLLTLNIMHSRYPNIIISTKCLFCSDHTELLNYLVICRGLENEWRLIVRNALSTTKKLIKRTLNINAPSEHIRRALLED